MTEERADWASESGTSCCCWSVLSEGDVIEAFEWLICLIEVMKWSGGISFGFYMLAPGYALEIDARVLIMFPTKNAEKTPYGIWHGKAPKFESDKILDEIQDPPIEPQTEEPSTSSIILSDFELVVEEANPTNVVVQAPPENQENYVYMERLEGFQSPKYPKRVCKLQSSIYGLKKALCSWNMRFDEKIKEFGVIQNTEEPCVYRRTREDKVVFLILYVDDILMMENDIPVLEGVKAWLKICFAMKDLGKVAYILGINIYRDRSRGILGLS
ncbi:retrotransposon protein, putative, ty1-copia subclass [Tanacetum coccineum]